MDDYVLVCEDSDCGFSVMAKPGQYRCECPECGLDCDPIDVKTYHEMTTGGIDNDA